MNTPKDLVEALRRLIAASSQPEGPEPTFAATLISDLEVSEGWLRALLGSWQAHFKKTKKPLFKELVRRGPTRFLTVRMLGTIRLVDTERTCRLCGLEVKAPAICWDRACWAEFEKFSISGWKEACRKAVRRANWKCELCELDVKKKIFGEKIYQVDHILPVALGGENNLENLQILCKSCHQEKTNHDMVEIRELRKQSKTINIETIGDADSKGRPSKKK